MLRRLPHGPRVAALVLAANLLIAAIFFAPLLAQLDSAILADDIFVRPGLSDAFNFLWGYWWVQKALSLGISPLHCSWILPPNGADLRLHTLPLLPAWLTWPLGALLGPVAGYNLSVLGLIVGGALAAQWTFRRAFLLSWPAAFAAGALFGYAPYFVYQAHSHIHLVGAAFWATALGQIVVAYERQDFRWRRGVWFAVALWATLYSSLLEFSMLLLVVAALVAAYELAPPAGRPTLAQRARFLLPALVGAVTLIPFLRGGTGHVAVGIYHTIRLRNLLRYPPLSLLSPPDVAFLPEFGGQYLPLTLLLPALAGAALAWREPRRGTRALAAVALFSMLLTLDALELPSRVLRALPLGSGIRVLSRFYPFFLFFAAALAGFALERLWRARRARVLLAALMLAGVAGFVAEYAPVRLSPSLVRRMPLPAGVELDRSRFLLVVPRRDYRNVQDTWAVTLDMRTVKLSFVGREVPEERWFREGAYPKVYTDWVDLSDPETISQLRGLGVGYVLLEHDARARPAWGREIARAGQYSLWSLSGR